MRRPGPGGRSWLTGRSLIARANFAAALVDGKAVGLPSPIDAQALDQFCAAYGVSMASLVERMGGSP